MNDRRRRFKRKSKLRLYLKKLRPSAIRRSLKYLLDPKSKFFGLDNLDQKLVAILDYPDGFFVELGANDWVSQSNTLYFERHRNWTGVLVEPTPHNYLLCLANRSPDNHIFCNACTSFDYRERFVEIAYSNLYSCPIGLESDVEDPIQHAIEEEKFLNATDEIFTFGSVAKPLNELLIRANAPHLMDLLSLDVEGAEIEVLKGIDHTRFRFRYMCVESRDKDKLLKYLEENSYEFFEQLTYHDYLFSNAQS